MEENKAIQRLLTPSAVYIVRTSKYNPNARSMNVTSTKAGSLLTAADNHNIEEEKAALRIRIADLHEVMLLVQPMHGMYKCKTYPRKREKEFLKSKQDTA